VITVVVANQKGGVAKTTTAITLASGLAALKRRVLLLDSDAQGNVASFLGLDPGGDLFDLVVARRSLAEVTVGVPGYDTLSIVRGDSSTTDINTLLVSGSRRLRVESVIALPLAQAARDGYDIAVIDTAPSLSEVQRAALLAGDWLIVPAVPEFASEQGVSHLARAVVELQESDGRPHLLGVLPVMVDTRSKEHAQTLADLERAFPGLVLPRVRRLIALGEAPRAGLPIWSYAPNSEAARDYAFVLREVIERAKV